MDFNNILTWNNWKRRILAFFLISFVLYLFSFVFPEILDFIYNFSPLLLLIILLVFFSFLIINSIAMNGKGLKYIIIRFASPFIVASTLGILSFFLSFCIVVVFVSLETVLHSYFVLLISALLLISAFVLVSVILSSSQFFKAASVSYNFSALLIALIGFWSLAKISMVYSPLYFFLYRFMLVTIIGQILLVFSFCVLFFFSLITSQCGEIVND